MLRDEVKKLELGRSVDVWLCGCVVARFVRFAWLCVVVWSSGVVVWFVWLCGCVVVWSCGLCGLCGCVVVRSSGCVVVWFVYS